jgi:hypothetical protein
MKWERGIPVRDFFWATVAALLSVLRFTAIAVPVSASRRGGPRWRRWEN